MAINEARNSVPHFFQAPRVPMEDSRDTFAVLDFVSIHFSSSARIISLGTSLPKRRVNSILYSLLSLGIVLKSQTQEPIWRINPNIKSRITLLTS